MRFVVAVLSATTCTCGSSCARLRKAEAASEEERPVHEPAAGVGVGVPVDLGIQLVELLAEPDPKSRLSTLSEKSYGQLAARRFRIESRKAAYQETVCHWWGLVRKYAKQESEKMNTSCNRKCYYDNCYTATPKSFFFQNRWFVAIMSWASGNFKKGADLRCTSMYLRVSLLFEKLLEIGER